VGLLGLGLAGVRSCGAPADHAGETDEVIQAVARITEASAADAKCADMTEGCLKSKCCSQPGTMCYEKQPDKWAQCRVSCNAGPDPADKDDTEWTCKELGPRAPGPAPAPNYRIVPAPWVQDKCAPDGEDCSDSKCCKAPGKRCYKKAKGWAACKVACTPGGPDPVDQDDHPWDCKEIGMRTPGVAQSEGIAADWVKEKCADKFENCQKSKCCKDPGSVCYRKSEAWAMCMRECTPGPLLTDRDPQPWNCTPLGGRTPDEPTALSMPQVAKWVKQECAKAHENCALKQCCAEETMQCYEKNKEEGLCMRGCKSGVNTKDNSTWTCKELGSRTPREWQSPSLYCFHVMMVNSYEAAIVREEVRINGGVGIFNCELSDVFASDGTAWLGDGPLGQVRPHHFTPAPVTKSVDGTAGNTALFMNVWDAVKRVGNYRYTDWTIKADPDAVVFPDRLRAKLRPHADNNPHGQYIVNCVKPFMTPMMFGSLEAISRKAMINYFQREGECKDHYDWGEDRWLGDCLNRLGSSGVQDFNFVGDKVCTYANCKDGQKAAYHFFKDAGSWKQCYFEGAR